MQYSKSQIKKLGKRFENGEISKEHSKLVGAAQALRYAHQDCLKAVYRHVLDVSKLYKDSICVGRIKRLATIFEKLRRSNLNTHIETMADISGCRLIVDNLNELNECKIQLVDILEENGIHAKIKTRNDLNTGYSGCHLICSFDERYNMPYSGMKTEIQLRTKIQHIWATTVELFDLLFDQKLKIGYVDNDYGEFMRTISIILSDFESGCTQLENNKRKQLINKINYINSSYNIEKQLTAFGNGLFGFNRIEADDNFLVVEVHRGSNYLKIYPFMSADQDFAFQKYFELENVNSDNQPLLIYASSLKRIYNAYPNYFSVWDKTIFDYFNEYIQNTNFDQ